MCFNLFQCICSACILSKEVANYHFQTKLIHLFIHSFTLLLIPLFILYSVISMVCMTLRYYSAEHKEGKMAKREVL